MPEPLLWLMGYFLIGFLAGCARAWFDPIFPKTGAGDFWLVCAGHLLAWPIALPIMGMWVVMNRAWNRHDELKRKAAELERWRDTPVEQLLGAGSPKPADPPRRVKGPSY